MVSKANTWGELFFLARCRDGWAPQAGLAYDLVT